MDYKEILNQIVSQSHRFIASESKVNFLWIDDLTTLAYLKLKGKPIENQILVGEHTTNKGEGCHITARLLRRLREHFPEVSKAKLLSDLKDKYENL